MLTLGYPFTGCPNLCRLPIGRDEPKALALNIYPQPATHSLNLATEAIAVEAQLLDLHGRRLQVWSLSGTQPYELCLPQVVPGLYLMELRDEAGRMVTWRVRLE